MDNSTDCHSADWRIDLFISIINKESVKWDSLIGEVQYQSTILLT